MTPASTVPPLRAAGATDVGRQRTTNEDRFHVDLSRGIFIVVDGIGGHAAGDVAADTAIAAMTERLARETGPVPDRLREAITIANNEIHRLAGTRSDWHGMACVLTAVVMDGDRAVIGHVGDSRLYVIHDDQIQKVTPDHSPVGQREDAHELSEAEAMRHPRRNEVFRDVGSEHHEVTETDFVFLAEISVPVNGGLLICSDGLTDLVPSDTIRKTVMARAGAPQEVARTLIAAANDAGGKDNVTVVFITRAASTVDAIAAPRSDAVWLHPRRRPVWLTPLLILLAVLAGFALGLLAHARGWTGGATDAVLGTAPAGTVIVRPAESIADAIGAALPGTTILVEPGEYRERLTLADNVRVVSRVPRGATLRLPGTATESDAAVVAAGVVNAELNGFRIVGDAATPLGIGVVAANASVRLVDLEVVGAATTAIDLGVGEDVALIGSDIHDNPGAALALRAGATPRVSSNVFTKNGTSSLTPTAILIEPGTAPVWLHNVFKDLAPAGITGLDDAGRTALSKNNWFIQTPPAVPLPAARRGGRGR